MKQDCPKNAHREEQEDREEARRTLEGNWDRKYCTETACASKTSTSLRRQDRKMAMEK
jgi:hypothetical protein